MAESRPLRHERDVKDACAREKYHLIVHDHEPMPIQRKIFRVEQTSSIDASTDSSDTAERRTFRIQSSGLGQLQHEADAIHNAIARTKQEIATMHAGASGPGGRRAARELDAVVAGTERAAHQIMDAAERIAKAAKSLAASQGKDDGLAQEIRDNVLRIFEACNFQDLSGQRIAKVLATLQFIDDSIARMMEIWGGAEAFEPYAGAARREPSLLHGPKLAGDSGHVTQADIDAILQSS
jgi:chemotaxis protein CheZ